MGLFGFGKKQSASANKTLVVLDWDRVSGLLTDLSFLKDRKNPELHIYSRKPSGVLLQDLQKKYPTQVHTVPQDERNFSNYMSYSIIYEFARQQAYSSVVMVFAGHGLGSAQRFMESVGIRVELVSLGNGDDRRKERGERGERNEKSNRGERNNNRQKEAAATDNAAEGNTGNNKSRDNRQPRNEGRRQNADNAQPRAPRNEEAEGQGRNRNSRNNRERKPRYEPTAQDAQRMAARFRELFNLFKDYPQEQLVILVKQATEQEMQVIFGSRNPRIIVDGLVHAGIASVPSEGKVSLSDFPSEQFCRQLLRVDGERLPRPERTDRGPRHGEQRAKSNTTDTDASVHTSPTTPDDVASPSHQDAEEAQPQQAVQE